ncbi:hypothetical protein AVEN_169033-1 [Araneus ventricosus]|uniref:Uncharacterized protein n=1 Tax=Araneus ventricosus TaxID=182803 RepID=A0A4Y2H0W1_ARAVE|nr:hypothetical protein AVEN_169033-1 [Araneus ventricosus]
MYEKTPCDVTARRGEYIRASLGSEKSVDRLERLWSFACSASKKAGELSAIESALIVVISDLLTVCVAKSESAKMLLPVNCCLFTLLICARSIVSCYLCYVFSCIFVNKPSFSIILRVGLFTPYTHRTIFVTIRFCHSFCQISYLQVVASKLNSIYSYLVEPT